uniref:Uncharacterized protein n=1 Tax=uncultured marine virus TaxID=186617 RepID=A0A0F7LA79_9VIRU|nr:hypothetical protein [uncultured marine virus]
MDVLWKKRIPDSRADKQGHTAYEQVRKDNSVRRTLPYQADTAGDGELYI